MGRRESPLEARAVAWARFRGIVTAKMTLCDGIPDRVFFVPGGRPLVVEFKAEGEEPEALQRWYLDALAAAGYRAEWCGTWEKFTELMEEGGKCGLAKAAGKGTRRTAAAAKPAARGGPSKTRRSRT